MPQFTPWNVPSPFPNVLFDPGKIDARVADTQYRLGTLGIERDKLRQQQEGGDALLRSLTGGTGTTSAYPADATSFEHQMGAAEGGGTADKVNAQGYAGQYQFGAARLADLGMYTPAQGENLKNNEWKGSFHIAPYNVTNLQDFLNNPAAQHAAFVAHVSNIDRAIDAMPGADKFDRNGLRAVAHLGGVGAMQRFVQSGGAWNASDANGTTLGDYYQRFARGGAPALQQAFGAPHGPAGPVGYAREADATLPVPPIPPSGGPPPPFNPNAGPRVAGAPPASPPGSTPAAPSAGPVDARGFGPLTPNPAAPTVTGDASADTPPPSVEPSRLAMRLGGADVAGPGGPTGDLLPGSVPNQMFQSGIPGVTLNLPGSPNGLSRPAAPAQAPVTAPVASPAPASQAGTPGRPPILQPPPAPARVIQREPLLPNGLTGGQVATVAAMIKGGAPVTSVAAHIEQMRQANTTIRQQDADRVAAEQNLQFQREQYVRQQQVQEAQAAEAARAKQVEEARLAEAAKRDTERLTIEKQKLEQGSSQPERDDYTLRNGDASSQQYAEAWARRKWTVAPNGNVIENDVSMYPAPTRSIQRPTFLPAPTPQALDEVRKADNDGRVITAGIDHYLDVFNATRGANWGAYFDNPASPEGQQLLGAFNRLKTVLRSPAYYNTGVLQPAEMKMLEQDLVSPQSLRGAFATPQALAARLNEIKLAVLTRQDAELRSIGRPGAIVRDKADFAQVPAGGQYYDKHGNLRVKPENQ